MRLPPVAAPVLSGRVLNHKSRPGHIHFEVTIYGFRLEQRITGEQGRIQPIFKGGSDLVAKL